MSELGNFIDKANTKPIYILTMLDPESKTGKKLYIKTRQDYVDFFNSYLTVKGIVISETDAKKAKKEKDRSIDGEYISMFVPYHQLINIIDITFVKNK